MNSIWMPALVQVMERILGNLLYTCEMSYDNQNHILGLVRIYRFRSYELKTSYLAVYSV
jgi:hypothetical protein